MLAIGDGDNLNGKEGTIASLVKVLKASFPDLSKDRKVGVALSGGLDSTIITAAALQRFGDEIELKPTVVGVLGSKDMKAAEIVCRELDLSLQKIICGAREVIDAVGPVSRYTSTIDPVVISFTIPLFMVLRSKGPEGVLVGHGGDELFGGYARYLDIPSPELQSHLDKDLKILQDRARSDESMAAKLGRRLMAPMLEPDFVEAARNMPMDLKVKDGRRKIALREMGNVMGLSHVLTGMKKTAAQYGSGVMKVLKKETRHEGLSRVQDLIKKLIGPDR